MNHPGEGWLAKGDEGLEESCREAVGDRRAGPLSSQDDVCMHLTNYAINKHSENFVRDDTMGSKRYALLFSPLSLPFGPTVSATHETEPTLGS